MQTAPNNAEPARVVVLPTVRPTPPPRPAPKRDAKKEARLCKSGEACPAHAELGQAEKLASANKEDYCYRCRTRRADEKTKSLHARRGSSANRRKRPKRPERSERGPRGGRRTTA